MITALDTAKYFLSKDTDKKLFNFNVVTYNNTKSYEGNIRLNKYLFLAQIVFLAKYGVELIEDDFVAYINGPVIKNIVNSFSIIANSNEDITLPSDIQTFLYKIYNALENATYEELIEITHEDPEWLALQNQTKSAPIMNLSKHLNEYKKRYKGLIAALHL